MRKALIILVIVFVLALGAGIWIWLDIDSVKNEVIVEEIVRAGDISAAEGLNIEVNTTFDYNLFWDTHFTAGSSGLQKSDYQVSVKREYDFGPYVYSGIYINNMLQTFRSIENLSPDSVGLERAYYDLLSTLEPGGYIEKEIYLKDYMDYYPLAGNLSIPGLELYFEPEEEFWGDLNSTEVWRLINDYFKIPVLEEESHWLSIGIDENGNVNSRGSGSASSEDIYDFYTDAVLLPDAVYFTINNRTSIKNEIIDTSLIPGGYGIYRIPYSVADGVTTADFEALSTVKQLDEEFSVIYMMSDEAQEKIILVGTTDSALSMMVIDAASMETLQNIELDSGEELHCWQYEHGEGFFMFYLEDNRMALVERQPDGDYALRFVIHDSAANELYNRYDIADVAWDGERLALAGFKGMKNRDWHYVADFYYAVYDETGLLCFVDCDSSLGINGDEQWSSVRGRDYEGIELRWK